MLNWFANKTNPIAIDIGTDSIKVLQVEPREGQTRLLAAATTEIPEAIRATQVGRDTFVVEALKKMLGEGFKGKQAVTCLPASTMAVQHFRVPKMTDEELAKALVFETAGKLPFDPRRAVMRHVVAGEVYQNQEAKQEVIVMAAPRDAVDAHLKILEQARLEVVGIHTEPTALIECFSHLFRRKGDENISTLFIDMGAGSTHVVIAHGKQMVFAKHIQVGGETFTKRVADAIKKPHPEARSIRISVSHHEAHAQRLPAGVVSIGASANPLGMNGHANGYAKLEEDTIERVKAAIEEPLEMLINELHLCVRYYESIFAGKTIDRAIFVGGESRHVGLCQAIAQRLNLPATLGDPLARLVKDTTTKCSFDMRQPQPGWAIAVGLGLGVAVE